MSNQKRVLVDGYNLGLETGTGVATYSRNLSYCLHDLGYKVDILYGAPSAARRDDMLREILFFDPVRGREFKYEEAFRRLTDPFRLFMGLDAKSIPMSGKIITTPFKSRMPYFDSISNVPEIFERSLKQFGRTYLAKPHCVPVRLPMQPDIAHWTFPLPLRVPGAKNVYTLHDLVPLRLPYTTTDNKRQYLALTRMLGKTADHIITVSETSRKDIIEILGVPPSKVTNTFQSVDIPTKYSEKPDDVVKREVEGSLNIKYKEYFLFYGAVEPKKNVGRMIEAYLASGVDTPLLIVGKLGWKCEQELRLLNADIISYQEQIGSLIYQRKRVLRVDFAPFPLLVSLIKGAKAVLFPSIYEGFGLPVLEAMQLGTPVLTSSESSTPEVAGDAAMIIDPYNPREMAEGIAMLDTNADLRASLSQKGVERAKLFSAEAHAKRVSEVYDSLLAG